MSSELVHPQADGGGVSVVGAGPWPGAGSRPRTAAEGSALPPGGQVRRSPPKAASADRRGDVTIPAAAGATGFTFAVARALGTVVVTAGGTIDAIAARALAHVLGDLIENQGNMTVVVDLHDVIDVDPRCLDIFVTAHHWAILRGGQLSLTGSRLRVARALEETGVNRLVAVTSDRILAVPASFGD